MGRNKAFRKLVVLLKRYPLDVSPEMGLRELQLGVFKNIDSFTTSTCSFHCGYSQILKLKVTEQSMTVLLVHVLS